MMGETTFKGVELNGGVVPNAMKSDLKTALKSALGSKCKRVEVTSVTASPQQAGRGRGRGLAAKYFLTVRFKALFDELQDAEDASVAMGNRSTQRKLVQALQRTPSFRSMDDLKVDDHQVDSTTKFEKGPSEGQRLDKNDVWTPLPEGGMDPAVAALVTALVVGSVCVGVFCAMKLRMGGKSQPDAFDFEMRQRDRDIIAEGSTGRSANP